MKIVRTYSYRCTHYYARTTTNVHVLVRMRVSNQSTTRTSFTWTNHRLWRCTYFNFSDVPPTINDVYIMGLRITFKSNWILIFDSNLRIIRKYQIICIGFSIVLYSKFITSCIKIYHFCKHAPERIKNCSKLQTMYFW